MRKLPVFLVALIGLVGMPVYAQNLSDGDGQFWKTFVVEGPLTRKLKLGFEEEFRIGDILSDLYYAHTEIGLSYKLHDQWTLGAGYRQAYEQKKEIWREERRPVFFITFSKKWRGVFFSDRNRFEHRDREASAVMWRYRNKLTATFPQKWTKVQFQPFLSDEFNVDMTAEEVQRNRFFAGVGHKISSNKHLKAETYYLWQVTRKTTDSSEWVNFNALGIKLKIEF